MPNLDDINHLRKVLEQGFAGGFAAGQQLAAFTRQNAVQFQKETPRLEIAVAIGAATGAKRGFAADQTIRFSRWNFTVKFTVLTIPQAAAVQQEGESDADFAVRQAANNALHEDAVAAVRDYAGTAAQKSGKDLENFPDHFVAEALRGMGSPSELKPQEGMEKTVLNYSGVVSVREAAWQAVEAQLNT